MYFIGIDIGTGSTKAVATDATGKVITTSQVSYPTLTPQPSHREQAPELLWQAFLKCIQRITTKMGVSPEAISLSSAMHSVIAVSENGEPLINMMIWADNRSAEVAKRLRHSKMGQAIYKQTGTPVHAMSPLTKIIWLKENEPALFQKVYKFISIKEYIWFRLFNTFEIDHSIASATGLFDIEQLRWHQPSLDLCGITGNHLSIPVSTHHQRKGIGAGLAQQLALAEETIFVIGASDGCLANLGSFAIQPGVAALTIGTSGAIRVAGTTPVSDPDAMPFNYRLDENIFISGGPINNGGIALRWYAENFLGRPLVTQEDYDGLLSLITEVPAGSEGLLFLPYLQGERAPIWNSEACGVFFGITSQHSQAYFTRSVLEGVSLALYQIARSLEDNGMAIHRIHVSGGFVRSLPWLQLLTDVFGKEVRLIHAEDASALGAIFLAMKALGIIEDYNQLDPGQPITFYPNDANHVVYREEVFPRYVQLYKALTLEMSVLHDTTQTKLNPIQ